MRLHGARWLSSIERVGLLAFVAVLAACGQGGGTTSGGGTGGGAGADAGDGGDADDGADETGAFEPDEEVCAPDPLAGDECQTAADCCPGPQPAAGFEADKHTCPGDTYPNDWSCDYDAKLEINVCVNAGCTDDVDCGQQAIDGFPAMICRVIESGGVGFCVRFCGNPSEDPDDEGCAPDTLHMSCTGVAFDGTKYCEQDPAP